MKNYSEMSNQEIALRVAQLSETYEDITFTAHDDYVELGDGANWRKFDPCNNPSDAWHIIAESKITLIACSDFWVACPANSVIDGDTSEPMEMMYCNSWGSATCVAGENPLRMAMVVFLIMKDAENEPVHS